MREFKLPCISIATGKGYKEIEDVSLEETTTALKIDYPLKNPAIKIIKYSSLYELIDEIRRVYKEVYKEEDETMTEYHPSGIPLNRGWSNGKYGIWGHVIEDLVISRITISDNGEIDLGIDS